ncbi:MAG: Hsp70 family protein [Fusobacteriaceae bacterium]
MKIIKVGIDLGTTNTLVATEDKRGKIKEFKFEGSDSLKSVLFYEDGVIKIGKEASEKGIVKPQNRIKSSKTYMGDHNKKWIIEGREFTPTDVATEILKVVRAKIASKMKLDPEDQIEAVITVPEDFTANQIDETRKAGENANLKVIKILTEPVAAAIAYGVEMKVSEKIFVLDLGGGTFDVTVLDTDINKGRYKTISTAGDKRLGGDNFDRVVEDILIERIKKETEIDFSSLENFGKIGENREEEFNIARSILLNEAEKTKIKLSEDDNVVVTASNIFLLNGSFYHLDTVVTREELREKSDFLIEKIEAKVIECLKNKGLRPSDIDRVILVGGSCYLPFMAEITEDLFEGKKPFSNMDLGTMVVQGAAMVALEHEGIKELEDIISHSLGIETIGKDGNPKFEAILEKGDIYPIDRKKIFTTVKDNQEQVQLNVYEGESIENMSDNEFYGGFALDDIENAPAGVPRIEVTFKFNHSRVLTVIAEDLKTGARKEVKVKKGERVAERTLPVDFVLLIDTSGSMKGAAIKSAKRGCITLIEDILDLDIHKHRLGLIDFGDRVNVLTDLTTDRKKLVRCIEEITVFGGTNMTEAIVKSSKLLENSTNQKVSVIVTDGAPNDKIKTLREAKIAMEKGIRMITIGAGNNVDHSYLKQISSTPKDYYHIDDIEELGNIFKKIVASIKTR